MGLFDMFKKEKKQEPAVSEPEEKEVEAVGWDAIEQEFLRVYPGQNNPKHYGTIIKWMLGGKDPLDGISVYDGGSYWHFVSFGQTEIYEKETDDPEISGYGYELTFKLKKDSYEDEEAEIRNICGILQMIARLTFTKGEIFQPFEYIYTGQTAGIDAQQKSNLTGFITVKDPTVETIDTPNGKVAFVELIGMTDAELKTLSNVGSVMEIYEKLGSDITDYHRQSLV
ncbi:MAG: suppressor of fused domain protein [Solobacterium sp.]|nr:suppressor of fused domain protein [Solobacterium sp.]